jgi:hypothetical protein
LSDVLGYKENSENCRKTEETEESEKKWKFKGMDCGRNFVGTVDENGETVAVDGERREEG